MNRFRLLALSTGLAIPLFYVDPTPEKTSQQPSLVGRWEVETATINSQPDRWRLFDELVFTEHHVEYRSTKPRVAPSLNLS